jgi:ubiquitin carboxyl-terminal hydrolase 7
LVAKNGVVADIIAALQKKAKLDDATIRQVRLYEAHGGKVYKELSPDHTVVGVGEYAPVYAEKIPDEELHAEEGDKFITAFHFQKEPTKTHGTSFKFLVKPVCANILEGDEASADVSIGRTLQRYKGTTREANGNQGKTV